MIEAKERRSEPEQLVRGLRLYDATMLVMGSMVSFLDIGISRTGS
mgnify:CR=1 FL=1